MHVMFRKSAISREEKGGTPRKKGGSTISLDESAAVTNSTGASQSQWEEHTMFRQQNRRCKRNTSSEGHSEWAEEPEQQRLNTNDGLVIRHEKIRLVVLSVSFLTLIFGFLSFLMGHTIVPLFTSIVLISLVYACLDAHFRACEHVSPLMIPHALEKERLRKEI